MDEKYRPIFFEKQWTLQAYHRWRLRAERDGIKVLERSYGIVRRILVLHDGANESVASIKLSADHTIGPTSEIILHEKSWRIICGKRFTLVSERDRLINNATFVLDVTRPRQLLLREMRSDFRQSIRKANEQGMVVAVSENPDLSSIDTFVKAFNKMAAERGLRFANRHLLHRMFRDGRLVMAVASLAGVAQSYALIYLAEKSAYYLEGVTVASDVAGKYLHYELVSYLQSRGVVWYDLGGVPEVNEKNGIYLFKKGFGGELVRLGSEFVFRPAIIRGIHAGVRAFRGFRVKVAA